MCAGDSGSKFSEGIQIRSMPFDILMTLTRTTPCARCIFRLTNLLAVGTFQSIATDGTSLKRCSTPTRATQIKCSPKNTVGRDFDTKIHPAGNTRPLTSPKPTRWPSPSHQPVFVTASSSSSHLRVSPSGSFNEFAPRRVNSSIRGAT